MAAARLKPPMPGDVLRPAAFDTGTMVIAPLTAAPAGRDGVQARCCESGTLHPEHAQQATAAR